VWNKLKDQLIADTEGLSQGDVTDFSNFMGAVIDDRSFAKQVKAIDRVKSNDHLTLLAGGQTDDSVGYFVRPTLVESTDPTDEIFSEEYFGPILAVHVYEDDAFETVVAQMENFAPYALTGAIISQDRAAIAWAQHELRFAAGNFYINDKPTGAVVGQQPFGGGRASGTNDKAGAAINLLRWTSPRSIKETFVPPKDFRYPHMDAE
jgi:1-pyrroline-5-carboxylate dehydrogenase